MPDTIGMQRLSGRNSWVSTQFAPDQIVPRGDVSGNKLQKRAKSSLLWTMGGQWISYAMQIVTGILLFKELGPTLMGLVGIALAFSMFADQFKSLGLSQAVIQRSQLTYADVNALFWVNAMAGMVLAGIMAAAAPIVAWSKDDPRLLGIMLGLSLSYIFAGLEVQPAALLARQLQFKTIGIRNTLARLFASIIALVVAFGFNGGYWAPVVLQVAYAALSALLVWALMPWRPSWPRGLGRAAEPIKFGLRIQAGEFFNVLSRNADYLLIGYVAGPLALGLYRGAYNLMLAPIRQIKTPLGTVVQPLMASVRTEKDRYRAVYLATVSGMAHIGMPLLVGLALFAEPIILATLGEEYRDAAVMFQFLSIAGVLQLVTTTSGWLLTTRELGKKYARMSMVTGLVTVGTFVVGIPWGAVGVAAAYAAGQLVIAPFQFRYCLAGSGITLVDVLSAMVRPLCVALLVTGPLVAIRWWLVDEPSWVSVCVAIPCGVVAWLGVLKVWSGARAEVMQLIGMAKKREPVRSEKAAKVD